MLSSIHPEKLSKICSGSHIPPDLQFPVLQVEKHLCIGGMKLNLAEKNVVIHGAEVMLTNREFEILYLLAQSPGRIFSKVVGY